MTRITPELLSSKATSMRRKRHNNRIASAAILPTKRSRTSLQAASKHRSANDQYRILKRKAEKLGFVVQNSKFSSERPGNVPTEHQARFEHIQALGRFKYSSYGLQPSPESIDKPWQLVNKSKANRVHQLAIICKEERQNEAGWRANIEYKLFERFEIEVACKRCRKRIWRSEIEVNTDEGNRSASLKERQARREGEPCRCGPQWRMDNIHDPGLSPIFSSRIQEPNFLHHDEDTYSGLVKKEPDRIHGLQCTTSLEKILQQHYGTQSQVDPDCSQSLGEVIQISCNPDNGGRKLLFPFLVMEAKSGKGASNFDDIEIQTAHPIMNLLVLQYELQHAKFNRMEVPGGPLAWFLANVGETWRVYGCYVTQSDDRSRPSWNIILLWEGSITGLDEALQLILIIDYILDWARDTYRPSILRQIKCIAAEGASSNYTVTHDSDILSMVNPIGEWLGAQNVQPSASTIITAGYTNNQGEVTKNAFELSQREPFKLSSTELEDILVSAEELKRKRPIFKDRHGLVRHGTMLDSRVRGMYITADNIRTLLQSFVNEKAGGAFVEKIQSIINTRTRCFILDDARALGIIEQIWTGDSTYSTNLSHATLVSVQVNFFVTEEWELVRELNYLAITEEAYNNLERWRRPMRRRSTQENKWSHMSVQQFVSFIEDEDKISRGNFFLRCLKRQVLALHLTPHMAFRHDARFRGKRGPVTELVSAIYKTYRIGNRKPDETFIRHAETVEKIPPMPGHPLWSAHQNGILVKGYKIGSIFDRKFCLYVIDEGLVVDQLAKNLASRFSPDAQVFNANITSNDGAPLRRRSEAESWSTQFRLESAPDVLRNLVHWIMKLKKQEDQLVEIRSAFPDITAFNKFMEYRREEGNCHCD